MSDKYLWYSKGSQETGALLADKLGFETAGTIPSKNFSGVAVCFGAAYTDKFRWEDRNFQAIFNDPRVVRQYTDRKNLFDKLGEAGLNTISCVPLTAEAQYTNICNVLAATETEGFVACKPSGAKARVVQTQADLQTAIDDGCNRALDRRFSAQTRLRVFVVAGNVVGALSKQPTNTPTYAARAAIQLHESDNSVSETTIQQVLTAAISKGLVSPTKNFWAPHSLTSTALRTAAIAVAEALGLDFCAVDFYSGDDGAHDVLNVVTTPNLREVPSVQGPIVNAISAWVTENSMTAKEILLSLINEANDEEASSLLAELRETKRRLTQSNQG